MVKYDPDDGTALAIAFDPDDTNYIGFLRIQYRTIHELKIRRCHVRTALLIINYKLYMNYKRYINAVEDLTLCETNASIYCFAISTVMQGGVDATTSIYKKN